VKPNGHLAMSGVLDTQAEKVASYYHQDFNLKPIKELNEWCLISGSKQS
jgi:ribosomal protein L11 methyltransferase